MILAFCFRKPVFAIAYHEKIENLAKDMEFSGFCKLSELKNMAPPEMLFRCGLPENLDDHCRRAAAQFDRLDAFLEGQYG